MSEGHSSALSGRIVNLTTMKITEDSSAFVLPLQSLSCEHLNVVDDHAVEHAAPGSIKLTNCG
jgi:hypothetical protein